MSGGDRLSVTDTIKDLGYTEWGSSRRQITDEPAVMQVTDDITNLSYASIFSSIGKQTPVIVRFSIVGASVGSPEWTRDPRGFAVKFYAGSPQGGATQGCIWDLVGNNLPVH